MIKDMNLAAEMPEGEREKENDFNKLFKPYHLVVETINILKQKHKSDQLLLDPHLHPGLTPNELREQIQSKCLKLFNCIRLISPLSTLADFCQKILANATETALDGVVFDLFYHPAQLRAVLEQDSILRINEHEYTMRDIFKSMLLEIAKDPDRYSRVKSQIGLRLRMVERHLKDKFTNEYNQAAINLGFTSKANQIYAGPQFKTNATVELECLIKRILVLCKTNSPINVSFNADKDMIISTIDANNNTESYNLTAILKEGPNWEHLYLSNSDNNIYDSFLKNKNNPPVYKHITESSVSSLEQIKREFPKLTLGECSAIHNYTSNLYTAINNLLRCHGQSDFLDFASKDEEFSNLLSEFQSSNFNNPLNLSKLVTEVLLTIAFAAHALTKPLCYDSIVIASSLGELAKHLSEMSGFVIAIIGKNNHKEIAAIQHGIIITRGKFPVLNFTQFYANLKLQNERSLLKFTDDEITTIQQILDTVESCKVMKTGKLELDNRFLACLLQEIGDENIFPQNKVFRADRNSGPMDAYTLSIINTLTKEGPAFRVVKGFYSTSQRLQDGFFGEGPGVMTEIMFPSGTVHRIANLSERYHEQEYLLPPGQQLLYTSFSSDGEHMTFEARPVRSVQYKEEKVSEPSITLGEKPLNPFCLLSPPKAPLLEKDKREEKIKKNDKETETEKLYMFKK